jgi:hypothetical protein
MAAIKKQISASTADFGTGKFDSELELPTRNQLSQNAWLTLTLKVYLNFADSKNKADNIVMQGSSAFAKDLDGWLFPILDWGNVPAYVADLNKIFQTRAEKAWNWQFLLKTPKDYGGLDSTCGSWLVRPNVLCLFRCVMVHDPALAHRSVTVVKLAMGTKSVKNIDPTKPAKKVELPYTSYTFRSDASHYDDEDVFAPLVYDAYCESYHDTIGHEIGHALNQDHIMGLRGVAPCKMSAGNTSNEDNCYGGTPEERGNIMGGGNRVYLDNAISWIQRMSEHAPPTLPNSWQATGIMTIPPRKIMLPAKGKVTPPF